MAWIGSLGQIS